MLDFKKDIKNAEIMIKDHIVKGYDKIYFASNENLKKIFSNTDFFGKKVLTVLGSGDQSFYFYNHNASQVDLFDINKLTIYFYYLRIWFIEIYNNFYLPFNFDNEFLIRLLNKVKPKTEEEQAAYNFWMEFYKLEIGFNYLQTELTGFTNEISELDKINKHN